MDIALAGKMREIALF